MTCLNRALITEKVGVDSDRNPLNYFLDFSAFSRENGIISIEIHSDMFHDRYPGQKFERDFKKKWNEVM